MKPDELGGRLRSLIDQAAPIDADEIKSTRPVFDSRDPVPRRRVALARGAGVVAVAAAIALVLGALAFNEGGHSKRVASTAPYAFHASSTPGDVGACNATITDGVQLNGSTGKGLCVGTGTTADGKAAVQLVANGTSTGGFEMDACHLSNADNLFSLAGTPLGVSDVLLGTTSPRASAVSIAIKNDPGNPVVAETFTVPGVDGIKWFATSIPGHGQQGLVTQLDADGQPLTWPANSPGPSPCA